MMVRTGKTPLPRQGGYGATQTFPEHPARIALGASTMGLTGMTYATGGFIAVRTGQTGPVPEASI